MEDLICLLATVRTLKKEHVEEDSYDVTQFLHHYDKALHIIQSRLENDKDLSDLTRLSAKKLSNYLKFGYNEIFYQ